MERILCGSADAMRELHAYRALSDRRMMAFYLAGMQLSQGIFILINFEIARLFC
jgi:hypothetical protein